MRKSLSTYLIVFLLLFWADTIQAQQPVTFEAVSTAQQVILGKNFQVSFVLKNAKGDQFKAPSFSNFKQLSGINSSFKSSNFNGQWETSTTYSVYLSPQKEGVLTIGPASIKVSNKLYKTKPIKVRVIKPDPSSQTNTQEDYFLKLIPSTFEAVPGQQINLDYKVYYEGAVDRFNIINESNYDGFYAHQIRRFDGIQRQEVVNGKQYNTKIIKRLALYPQQSGDIEIPSVSLRIAVPIQGAANNSPFTFLRPTESKVINSDIVNIKVNPLPSPVPSTFTGAVGNSFNARIQVVNNKATTDDAVTMFVTLEGEGDVNRVIAPELVLSDTFTVYEPDLVDEQSGEINGVLYGQKMFKYIILPKYAGEYDIVPEFTYFNPIENQFESIPTDTIHLSITRGVNNANVNVKPVEEVKEIPPLNPLKTSLTIIQPKQFVGTLLFYLGILIPILLAIVAFLYKNYINNLPEIDVVEEKRKNAQKVAKQRLSTSKDLLDKGDYRSFYDNLSKVMIGYVKDKFNITGSKLSKNNVEQHLTESGAQEEHIQRFMSILHTCERAVFAMKTEGDAQQLYNDATQVIVDIEM